MNLLSTISGPSDLKQLPIDSLPILAQEIRNRIIEVMSVNGGHLASNLGVVELTIALHYVFSSPEDRMIFDVSHQCYPHKLLTGRQHDSFTRIRQSNGASGFCHPGESPHDIFFAGHAATALSLALGIAKTRDLKNENYHVLPIIGDATLTCGLALEALNNMDRDLKQMIVILNDNEMSISKNVGSIKGILSRLINNPTTSKWAFELEKMIEKIPKCGHSLAQQGNKFSHSVKNLVSSAPFFEQYGLAYIGPTDGHDLKKMIALFDAVKNLKMPVILHLLTKKGYGLEKAEADPITFHGVKPFNPKTCEFYPATTPSPTFPKLFGKWLKVRGKEDEKLVVLTPATAVGGQLEPFMEAFPNRSFDVGIAEGHAAAFAGGLAKGDHLHVILAIYSTFLQRALDHLYHDIALQGSSLVIAIDRAGLAPQDGATHHGIFDISFLRTLPEIVICQPRNGNVFIELLEASFSYKKPVAIRYPNQQTQFSENLIRQKRVLGKGEVLAEGKDLLIIALGTLCQVALEVREKLLEEGIIATVVDPIFVVPLDTELLSELLFTHNKILTIEEHSLHGGLGDEVNHYLLNHGYNVEVNNVGIPRTILHHDRHEVLLDKCGLSVEKLCHQVLHNFSWPLKTNEVKQ